MQPVFVGVSLIALTDSTSRPALPSCLCPLFQSTAPQKVLRCACQWVRDGVAHESRVSTTNHARRVNSNPYHLPQLQCTLSPSLSASKWSRRASRLPTHPNAPPPHLPSSAPPIPNPKPKYIKFTRIKVVAICPPAVQTELGGVPGSHSFGAFVFLCAFTCHLIIRPQLLLQAHPSPSTPLPPWRAS